MVVGAVQARLAVPLAGPATLTVTLCAAEPPGPKQVSANFVVAVRLPLLCEPPVDRTPLQPPEAVQEVALIEDQVRVEAAPLVTVLGVALKVTAGVGADTDTVAD